MKKFCENCLKLVSCKIEEEIKEIFIDNNIINFLEKYYICDECKSKFYDDLYDYNFKKGNEAIRKKFKIITINEINDILNKYNIGKKNLSLVLGLGEITITRYIDGQNPTKENSELLLNIYNNPYLYELFLLCNKNKITDIAYRKSLGKTKQLQLCNNDSKIYNSALYIINKLEDTTPLALQKILYFAQCFSKKILNNYIFNNCAEAWKYGPVYKDIYDCFSYYKSGSINYSELLKNYEYNLSDEEKNYLNKIIRFFGCYSSTILRDMTHLTDPWIVAREGLEIDETSNRRIDLESINIFVDKICDDYRINNVDDIKKYSDDLFNNIMDNNYL